MSERVLLDPTSERTATTRERAARRPLTGARSGSSTSRSPAGNVFLDRLQELLEGRGLHVERFAKPTFTKPAPPDLRHEIAAKCDMVIEALAD